MTECNQSPCSLSRPTALAGTFTCNPGMLLFQASHHSQTRTCMHVPGLGRTPFPRLGRFPPPPLWVWVSLGGHLTSRLAPSTHVGLSCVSIYSRHPATKVQLFSALSHHQHVKQNFKYRCVFQHFHLGAFLK